VSPQLPQSLPGGALYGVSHTTLSRYIARPEARAGSSSISVARGRIPSPQRSLAGGHRFGSDRDPLAELAAQLGARIYDNNLQR
jgi:hypothetical protein